MSFDVSFSGFRDGAATAGGGKRMAAVLEPYVVHRAAELDFLQVEMGDGVADAYLDDDTMLVNHVTGNDPWDLLVIGARAADWAIVAAGRPTCLTDESQRRHLPGDLAEGAVVVTSGPDLLAWLLGNLG